MMRTSTYRLSGEFVAESCGGRLLSGAGIIADAGVGTDTRNVKAGEAFVALKGPRFDAHDFLAEAVIRGAVGLVVEEGRAAEAIRIASTASSPLFVVAVPDTTEALLAMAHAWIEVMVPVVLAITGSVGKTTTKDLTAVVVSTRHETLATAGNLNNRIGLSLMCLRLLPRHEVFVAEMGMNAAGEIAELCRIAPPRIGVVTSVAPVHLEGLGTLENVAAAKAELVRALPSNGLAVLNADDPFVARMAEWTAAKPIRFGRSPAADVRIAGIRTGTDGRIAVTLEHGGAIREARLELVGTHHASNAAAAVAAGLALGVGFDEAVEALAAARPGRHRSSLLSLGAIRLLDDCYNASPVSMTAALTTLASLRTGGRRVAVLGDLLELGDYAETAHRELGREVATRGVDLLVAVGRHRALVVQAAVAAGMPAAAIFDAPDAISASAVAVQVVRPGDTVLVKGSRGVSLDQVVDALAARFQGDGPERSN
jgi:UDP-N-acetylmuramoyl-tripeptide--D-alanyl-D-alanine ligase